MDRDFFILGKITTKSVLFGLDKDIFLVRGSGKRKKVVESHRNMIITDKSFQIKIISYYHSLSSDMNIGGGDGPPGLLGLDLFLFNFL